MSNKILKYVRAVVFIAIVAGLIKCMDYAMMPSGYIRYIIHETDNADTILTVIIDGLDGGAETHERAVFLRVWENRGASPRLYQ